MGKFNLNVVKGGSKKPSLRKPPKSVPIGYIPASDRTLTPKQSKQGFFRLKLKSGYTLKQLRRDFRARSNLTLGGYKSGYHESAVTTDTYNFLREAKENKDGTHTLPTAPKISFFAKFNGKKVFSSTLETVLELADSYRTDTAQTILSAPEGRAAGHSGSGIDLTGQSAAHDLLRQKAMDILQIDPKTTKGINKKSIATLFASITVTSMAPGEIARTVTGGTKSLKAESAKETWEERRNEAKRRVEAHFAALTPDERSFVNQHAISFMESTQVKVRQNRRNIPSLGRSPRATSPERDTRGGGINEVQGGKYLLNPSNIAPTLSAEAETSGLYFTQPFRADRQE